MADSKLSALTLGSAIADADLFYSDQSATSVKQPASALKTYIGSLALVIGTTTITGGTDTHVLYDNAGVLGEASAFTISSGQPNVPTGSAYLYGGQNFGFAMNAIDSFYLGKNSGGNAPGTDTGGANYGIGLNCLTSIGSGSDNTALGSATLTVLTTGVGNTAMGFTVLQNLIDGSFNTAVGQNALKRQTHNNSNTAVGAAAMTSITTGSNNTGVGVLALSSSQADSNNTAIGRDALSTLNGGSQNVAIGFQALFDQTTASNNTAVGYNTGRGITTGGNNTIVGAQVTGLASGLTGAIILADGSGAIKLDYNNTNASKWTLAGNLIIPALSTAGTLVNDSSGNVTSSNTVLGMSRVSSQFNSSSNALANITGLTANLSAGKSYAFRVYLHVSPDAVGGHQYAMGGTCTATNIIYQINSVNNSTNANIINSRQTALGGAVGVVSGMSDYTEIVGLITVANAGTLTAQFAQNVANGTSSVLVGSLMEVNDTP